MRAYVTGATGFVGGALARRLLDDGHDLTVLARTPSKAQPLEVRGARIVEGDVTDRPARLAEGMRGADVVFHLAAIYEVGPDDPQRMERINVDGTRNVLTAAEQAGVPTTVYCSTVAALGSTRRGERADERALERDRVRLSTPYERTKHAAHLIAEERAATGYDVRIGCPTLIYGPGDTSDVGWMMRFVARGLMPVMVFAESELTFVHVDDVADGLVRIAERGEPGATYVIGGEVATLGEFASRLAREAGQRPPRGNVPMGVLKAVAPLTAPVMRAFGRPPRMLAESIAMFEGQEGWAYRSDRAKEDLGYDFRSIERGLPETVEWTRRAPLRS